MSDRDDLIEDILARDGGTCHDFGKQHCFNDPTAKWENRRCQACHEWAEATLRAVEGPVRAHHGQQIAVAIAAARVAALENLRDAGYDPVHLTLVAGVYSKAERLARGGGVDD